MLRDAVRKFLMRSPMGRLAQAGRQIGGEQIQEFLVKYEYTRKKGGVLKDYVGTDDPLNPLRDVDLELHDITAGRGAEDVGVPQEVFPPEKDQ
jgi:hypothetical protein